MKSQPILLVVAILVVAGLSLKANANAPKHPNVVIVITDDQGYGDLSCHGNPVLKTPNIDDLYNESVRLTDYHVAPTCSPTRAALQSGHWTNRTGVWHTIMGRSMIRENEPTIGQVFSDAGYATGMFGKWHLGDNYPYRPEDRGYTEVLRHGGGGVGQTPDYWDNAYFDGSYWHNGTPVPVKGYCTDVFFDYAKKFIETQKADGKPFLAYISTNAPHGPQHAPKESAEPYLDGHSVKLAHFFGMIANIDDNVGKLRKFLDSEGLTENTIFIFNTDNGTAGGAKIFNANMKGQKGSAYDGGHRVPFFLHWPGGGMKQPTDVQPISHAVDVLPTLIDLCGIPAPKGIDFDGKNISSLLKGNPDSSINWDERILITDSQRVKDPIMWKSSSVMTSRWRLINGEELYDIKNDPSQKSDVSSAFPAEVRRLRDFYEGWWEELLPSFKQSTAIYLGHPNDHPARLTSHDWITTGSTPWNQLSIRRGNDEPSNMGFWNVNVHQAGKYEIRLRRWPEEAKTGINSGMKPGAPVTGVRAFREQPGRKFNNLTRASIKIADKNEMVDFKPDAQEAVVTTTLPKGKSKLTATFHAEDGSSVGAYYAYIKLLSPQENTENKKTQTALPDVVDPQQSAWYKKYRTQKNIIAPADMLINTDAEPALTDGFTELFNGKDLTGWTPKGGTCKFEVKDGLIVGTCVPGSDSTYLSTDKADYSDFIFTCDIKWEVDGNTGVQFRSQSKTRKRKETVFGPQFEMEGTARVDRNWSGGIYGQSCGGYFYPLWLKQHKEIRSALKPKDWNRVTIMAQGTKVQTWLNGIPAANWVGDGTYAKGFFALQVHKGKAGTMLFKNVRVKEL